MSRWTPQRDVHGRVIQSSIPTAPRASTPGGQTFRGVVIAVYVYDSADGLDAMANAPTYNGIYCDVRTYGRWNQIIRRVLWTSDRQGMHEGAIDLPRPTTLDTAGDLNVNISNPASMDGDHVIVGFLEDDWAQPYIQRSIPHPSSDIGNDGKDLGQRMRVTDADGHPRFRKHRGVAWGVDKDGNYLIDARTAHKGEYQENGKEPDPAEDGSSGNYVVKLPKASTVTISIEDGATLTLTDKDGAATLTLGDGAVKMAVADHLEVLYGNLKAEFDAFNADYLAHTHLYAFGPTGPGSGGTPPAGAFTAPDWDPNINSDKLTTPDTG